MRTYSSSELAEIADPSFDQHFLVSPTKLALIVAAAGIEPSDAVVEIGAGVGTVARNFPRSRELTLVELDARLIPFLRDAAPSAKIIQGDALSTLESLSFDVLVSNLPNRATYDLLVLLPTFNPRTAVVTMGEPSPRELELDGYQAELVTTIGGDDFSPWQASTSTVVRFTRVR